MALVVTDKNHQNQYQIYVSRENRLQNFGDRRRADTPEIAAMQSQLLPNSKSALSARIAACRVIT